MVSIVPREHQALVLESIEAGIKAKTVPTPEAVHGSVIVKVLAANIVSYHREIYNGERRYSFPTPLVPGSSSIARVAAVGPDATLLKPGQLVYVDCVVRARDDPGAIFLSAINEGSSEGSRKLMREVWRDGAFAEYARVPLENCIILNETRLCKELGYSYPELMYMSRLLVPFGGLRDIGLEPGQTVIVSPATGGFGGAGVHMAAAMGARVIAMGRNEKELGRIKACVEDTMSGSRIETVKITGDEVVDAQTLKALGPIDAILDLSPPTASESSHMKSALAALRYEGRVSLMGFSNVTSSPSVRWALVGNNITLKGKLMYSRSDMLQFVKILERGLFPSGKKMVDVKCFKLADYKEALDEAAGWTGLGKIVVFSL